MYAAVLSDNVFCGMVIDMSCDIEFVPLEPNQQTNWFPQEPIWLLKLGRGNFYDMTVQWRGFSIVLFSGHHII